VGVAPDGALLATGHDGGNIVVWDAATLDVKMRLQTAERGLAHPFFSPDATLLAAGCQENGDVVIWNLGERQEVGRYTFEKGNLRTYMLRPSEQTFRPEKDPTRFCFSPDGEAFLVGCYGGILRATAGGQELRRFGE
jgi:WD40 repeat protein